MADISLYFHFLQERCFYNDGLLGSSTVQNKFTWNKHMRSTNRKKIIPAVQMCKLLSLPKFNRSKKVVDLYFLYQFVKRVISYKGHKGPVN
jgi:hypothetical protein